MVAVSVFADVSAVTVVFLREVSYLHSKGIIMMTAPHIVDPAGLLTEALGDASPDLMRSPLQTMINALLSADADAVAGAESGQPAPDRLAQRNGTHFREWLMERRKRAETA